MFYSTKLQRKIEKYFYLCKIKLMGNPFYKMNCS